jgi:hypothetical protein
MHDDPFSSSTRRIGVDHSSPPARLPPAHVAARTPRRRPAPSRRSPGPSSLHLAERLALGFHLVGIVAARSARSRHRGLDLDFEAASILSPCSRTASRGVTRLSALFGDRRSAALLSSSRELLGVATILSMYRVARPPELDANLLSLPVPLSRAQTR